jgi:hypothetical protein
MLRLLCQDKAIYLSIQKYYEGIIRERDYSLWESCRDEIPRSMTSCIPGD